MTNKIEKFTGDHRWLSNFIGGVEQKYQAAKTDDPDLKKAILESEPGTAKRAGRQIGIRGLLIRDWHQRKFAIMEALVRDKFSQSPFKEKLLATGDTELIEGNCWHDNVWGVCECPACKRGGNVGRNQLGKIIMKIREELREAVTPSAGE